MILNPHICGDPAERAITRLITAHLDKFVAASGLGEAFRQGAFSAMHSILLDGSYDIIEPVATVTPRTGNIDIRFRISDTFDRALARAAENCNSSHIKTPFNLGVQSCLTQ